MSRYINILIFCLIFLTLSTSFSQNYWRPLLSPVSKSLNRVCFLDSLTGWVVGDSGTIIKTTNGGEYWFVQNSNIPYNIVDIYMLNNQRGWALAHNYFGDSAGTFLVWTSNGGENWNVQFYPIPYKYFFSTFLIDSLNGWMVGKSGEVVGTRDGGKTWYQAELDSASRRLRWDLFRVRFFTQRLGFATGGRYDLTGVIWRTTNGGATWHTLTLSPEPLFDVYFKDSLNGIGVGGDYEFGVSFVRTSDGGVTWSHKWLGIFGQGRAMAFRTPAEGWVPLGFAGAAMYTLDSGQTWTSITTQNNRVVHDIVFTDFRTGYMVGRGGTILKYNYFANEVSVKRRWNIVSVPLTVVNRQKSRIFPSAISEALTFTERGYEIKDTLQNGVGYWAKFPAAEVFELEGFARLADTFVVRQGWNMVGSISYPVPVSTILSEPQNIITSDFFEYNNGYVRADTILPGKGYWVKVNENGRLILITSLPKK